ncbi:MAG: hypothetical protein MRY83_17015, partial [Flavobacteriales bacterium]|nr:hypothetical protein [Flavobacteriales bacterium]
MSNRNYIYLVPILTLLVQFLYLMDIGKVHFFFWADPGYNYLLNGLNIANGIFEVGHTDHPGSTLQIFSAFVIKLVSLFRAEDMILDVFKNPEFYIKIISCSILSIMFAMNLLIGRRVLKLGMSYFGIVFQLIPFCSFTAMEFSVNLMTEPFLIIGMQLLVFYLLPFLHFYEQSPSWKNVLGLALIIGFLLATKISVLPICAIPFFLFRGWVKKIVFALLVPLSFSIFAIPLWVQYQQFFRFIKKIWGHSGQYGKGSDKFIETADFLNNFKALLKLDWLFTLSIVAVIIILIVNASKKKNENSQRIVFGVMIFVFGQFFMVSKHFSYHYFIPSLLTFPILWNYLKTNINSRMFWHLSLLVLLSLFTFRNLTHYGFFEQFQNPYRNFNLKYSELQSDKPLIISGGVFGAFSAPSFRFGLSYSGAGRSLFNQAFDSVYPNTYFKEHGKIYDVFQKQYSLEELLMEHSDLYYYDRIKGEDHAELRNKELNENIFLIDSNAKTQEVLYKLSSSSEIDYERKLMVLCYLDSFYLTTKIIFTDSDSIQLGIGGEID